MTINCATCGALVVDTLDPATKAHLKAGFPIHVAGDGVGGPACALHAAQVEA